MLLMFVLLLHSWQVPNSKNALIDYAAKMTREIVVTQEFSLAFFDVKA